MDEKVRLSKIMAQKGLCSRREADELISSGLVKVNGVIVSQLGSKVNPDCEIELIKKAQTFLASKVTIAINKPVGFVTSQAEKSYKSSYQLLQARFQDRNYRSSIKFSHLHKKKLAPAGRLDIDSRGLLIFTQDGTLAKKIIGENSKVSKEYTVRVTGHITDSKIEKLCYGLSLDEVKLKPAKIKMINDYTLNFVLNQGRKRQIRRMCELVNLKVTGLKRTRIGNLKLGSLKEGHWRYLEPNEVKNI